MIIAVVLINAVVGFLQEGRAEQALERDRTRCVAPRAAGAARRPAPGCGRSPTWCPATSSLLEPGDRVPADLRLLQGARPADRRGGADRRVGRRGEADGGPVAAAAALGDRACMAYSGTLVAAGQGARRGRRDRAARPKSAASARMLGAVAPLATPLLRQIDRFGRRFALLVLGLSARCVRLRGAGARLRLDRGADGGGRHGGRRHPGGAAGGDHHHPGDRRAAHGGAPRDHPPAAGGRDAGCDLGDLHRQDRHADAQRDDGAAAVIAGGTLRGRRATATRRRASLRGARR